MGTSRERHDEWLQWRMRTRHLFVNTREVSVAHSLLVTWWAVLKVVKNRDDPTTNKWASEANRVKKTAARWSSYPPNISSRLTLPRDRIAQETRAANGRRVVPHGRTHSTLTSISPTLQTQASTKRSARSHDFFYPNWIGFYNPCVYVPCNK